MPTKKGNSKTTKAPKKSVTKAVRNRWGGMQVPKAQRAQLQDRLDPKFIQH